MPPHTPSPSRTVRRWSASTTAPAYRPVGAVYRPRRPTETPLYPVVQHHLETFLAQAQHTDPMGWGVPRLKRDDDARRDRRGVSGAGDVDENRGSRRAARGAEGAERGLSEGGRARSCGRSGLGVGSRGV